MRLNFLKLIKPSALKTSDNSKSTGQEKEYAEPIDWAPQWSIGAPLPQIFANGIKTFLIYFIDAEDRDWDGSYITTVDNKTNENYDLALVEFIRPNTHRFGTVNDEAADGHPLYDNGLETYSAHIVRNSSWIQELKLIHKVHPYYKEETWAKLKHFLLFFHDEMFEIIAEDYKVELFQTTFLDLSMKVVSRMNS